MSLRQWSSRAARAALPSLRHGPSDVEDPPAINQPEALELDEFCLVEVYDLEGFNETTDLYCVTDEVRDQELTNTLNGYRISLSDRG